MKVYRPGSRGKHTLMVAPGVSHPISDFVEGKGKDRKPKQFNVVFVEGVAEVSENLGRYLLNNDLAKRSPIIVPE
ncbi:hypothetical protein [Cupriavidus basilensis]|jgi:hypothetical protein|uniref:hypothetical protein n=1 Tax=Cupriavidus basilensis TaxID=68895 RepID=UPI00204CE038|nr:hypothetical protein [Cupriavidus basilensis]MCP3017540.1 hypothetical protein [Cupriavidus basilensis]DAF77203.1 MAG TPA: hypothetical protein [Caudoviricetes sp.]